MSEDSDVSATIRYWAAARDAAGVAEERYEAGTLAELIDLATGRHEGHQFSQVLGCCSFLVDGAPVGARDHGAIALDDGATVEALPPFAGG